MTAPACQGLCAVVSSALAEPREDKTPVHVFTLACGAKVQRAIKLGNPLPTRCRCTTGALRRVVALDPALVATLRERAERPDDDVILQVLAVSSGAHAVGVESPCAVPSRAPDL